MNTCSNLNDRNFLKEVPFQLNNWTNQFLLNAESDPHKLLLCKIVLPFQLFLATCQQGFELGHHYRFHNGIQQCL
jgi:hypothetical protein